MNRNVGLWRIPIGQRDPLDASRWSSPLAMLHGMPHLFACIIMRTNRDCFPRATNELLDTEYA